MIKRLRQTGFGEMVHGLKVPSSRPASYASLWLVEIQKRKQLRIITIPRDSNCWDSIIKDFPIIVLLYVLWGITICQWLDFHNYQIYNSWMRLQYILLVMIVHISRASPGVSATKEYIEILCLLRNVWCLRFSIFSARNPQSTLSK